MFVAGVLFLGLTSPSVAASPPERFCGWITANVVRNEVHSSGTRIVRCETARRVLRSYWRTRRRNVGEWRCNRGGTNGAVLAQCTQPGRFIVIYDARHGE